ncbi:MAG: hypoxanthine phosphoribosyltransferase [Ignavibacteria bacterium]|nr:hypoxanthine phosphoribosyltransferase [Ignavibacteria bacterium]
MNEIQINGETFMLLLSEEQIQQRVRELGKKISEDYIGTIPIFVGVLNGAAIFLSDLIRCVSIKLEIDFLKLSSYGEEKFSSGSVKMLKDLDVHLGGRDIIIVEDIVDTGLSINFIQKLIEPRNPSSVRIASLLLKKRKYNQNNAQRKIDYVGFEISDEFVIGYGLDYTQQYRNLRAIYHLSSQSERRK